MCPPSAERLFEAIAEAPRADPQGYQQRQQQNQQQQPQQQPPPPPHPQHHGGYGQQHLQGPAGGAQEQQDEGREGWDVFGAGQGDEQGYGGGFDGFEYDASFDGGAEDDGDLNSPPPEVFAGGSAGGNTGYANFSPNDLIVNCVGHGVTSTASGAMSGGRCAAGHTHNHSLDSACGGEQLGVTGTAGETSTHTRSEDDGDLGPTSDAEEEPDRHGEASRRESAPRRPSRAPSLAPSLAPSSAGTHVSSLFDDDDFDTTFSRAGTSPPPEGKSELPNTFTTDSAAVPPYNPFDGIPGLLTPALLADLCSLFPSLPLVASVPLPKNQADMPEYDPNHLAIFLLEESLSDLDLPAFQRRDLDLLSTLGNFVVYTSDVEIVAAHISAPFKRALGIEDGEKIVVDVGRELKELVKVAPVLPHKQSDPRSHQPLDLPNLPPPRGKKRQAEETGDEEREVKKQMVKRKGVVKGSTKAARKVAGVRQRRKKGEVGTAHYCYWAPKGQDSPALLDVSAEMRESSKGMNKIRQLGDTIGAVYEMAAKLTFAASPSQHAFLKSQFDLKVKGSAYTTLLNNPYAIHPGLAIVNNVPVAVHTDAKDPKNTFGIMAPFGNFAGGRLVLPQLGLATEYRAGDFVLIRARLIKHGVEPFAGDRHAVVFFWRDWLLKYPEWGADWENIKRHKEATYGPTREEWERRQRRLTEEGKEKRDAGVLFKGPAAGTFDAETGELDFGTFC
ncbi:hypothetical protein JCM10213_004121 [Rhodosporidiobolus nylandii]